MNFKLCLPLFILVLCVGVDFCLLLYSLCPENILLLLLFFLNIPWCESTGNEFAQFFFLILVLDFGSGESVFLPLFWKIVLLGVEFWLDNFSLLFSNRDTIPFPSVLQSFSREVYCNSYCSFLFLYVGCVFFHFLHRFSLCLWCSAVWIWCSCAGRVFLGGEHLFLIFCSSWYSWNCGLVSAISFLEILCVISPYLFFLGRQSHIG